MMNFMKKMVWTVFFVVLFSSAAMAQTDTVYVRKHVTDTVFVKSPPDTVYIKKTASKAVDSIHEKNEFVTYYDTDTIPPAINFYIDGSVGANIILLALGVGVFGFELEQENMYRGSIIYNFSALMQFHDIWKEWEGIKSIWSLGVGYRHYIVTSVITHANPSKHPVKHRNVPLNSLSLFAQAMVGPTLNYDKIRNVDDDDNERGASAFGGFAKGTMGLVGNFGNLLWEFGLSGGYQYWGEKARLMMNTENVALVNGSSLKGAFFGFEIKLGF